MDSSSKLVDPLLHKYHMQACSSDEAKELKSGIMHVRPTPCAIRDYKKKYVAMCRLQCRPRQSTRDIATLA
jgi:hypothetical protein